MEITGEKGKEEMKKQKTTRPDAIDKLMRRKGQFLRAALQTKNLQHRKELEDSANLCDVKIMRFHRRGKSLVRRAKDRLLEAILFLFLLLLIGGCTANAGVGIGGSLYYPEGYDPSESRKHSTQPTVGMARNNELPMVGDN